MRPAWAPCAHPSLDRTACGPARSLNASVSPLVVVVVADAVAGVGTGTGTGTDTDTGTDADADADAKVYIWRGTAERDVGVRRRVSDNRHDSNHRRLARAPRGGLRGQRPQSFRPPLQAAPSVELPRRAPPCPGRCYGLRAAATFGIFAKLFLSAAFSSASSGLTLPSATSFASTASMLCIP